MRIEVTLDDIEEYSKGGPRKIYNLYKLMDTTNKHRGSYMPIFSLASIYRDSTLNVSVNKDEGITLKGDLLKGIRKNKLGSIEVTWEPSRIINLEDYIKRLCSIKNKDDLHVSLVRDLYIGFYFTKAYIISSSPTTLYEAYVHIR